MAPPPPAKVAEEEVEQRRGSGLAFLPSFLPASSPFLGGSPAKWWPLIGAQERPRRKRATQKRGPTPRSEAAEGARAHRDVSEAEKAEGIFVRV